MQAHNDRRYSKHSNKDIDVDKSHLNYDLVEAQGSYAERYREQMRKYYKSSRKVRSDATVVDEWIFGADKDFFSNNSDEEQRRYFASIKDFMAERYGNHVIYATVHVDEQTPHMHLGMVPLTADGRLSHKAIFNKTELTKIHRDLHKHLTQQGFELDAPDRSTREHLSVAEFKLQKSNEALQKNAEAQKALEEQGKRYLNNLDKVTKQKFADVDTYTKQQMSQINQREQAVTERESQVELQARKNVSERNKLKEVHESLKKMQSSQNAREERLNAREAKLSGIATSKGDALRVMLYRDFVKQQGINVREADVYVMQKFDDMSKYFEPQHQQQNGFGYGLEL